MDEELGRLLIQFWFGLTLFMPGFPEFGCRATEGVAELLAMPPNVVGVRIPWWPPIIQKSFNLGNKSAFFYKCLFLQSSDWLYYRAYLNRILIYLTFNDVNISNEMKAYNIKVI